MDAEDARESSRHPPANLTKVSRPAVSRSRFREAARALERGLRGDGELESEAGARAGFALDLDGAAVQLQDALGDGQAQARALGGPSPRDFSTR